MHPTARHPRTSNSFQTDPVKSLSGLFILVVLALALLAPVRAIACGTHEARSLSFTSAVPTADGIAGLCDGGPLTQDTDDPAGARDGRVVTLGNAERDVPGALHPSALLVRVSADGREVTAVCQIMVEEPSLIGDQDAIRARHDLIQAETLARVRPGDDKDLLLGRPAEEFGVWVDQVGDQPCPGLVQQVDIPR